MLNEKDNLKLLINGAIKMGMPLGGEIGYDSNGNETILKDGIPVDCSDSNLIKQVISAYKNKSNFNDIKVLPDFPSSDCVTLGCTDISECLSSGICPYVSDKQKEDIRAKYNKEI